MLAAPRAAVARFHQRHLHPALIAGAWFFIVLSLGCLATVVGTTWGDPLRSLSLFEAAAGGETLRALGLTYEGTTGLLLALVELTVVTTAVVATLRPPGRARRLGHAALIAWAALWTLDLVHLAAVDPGVTSIGRATLCMTLLAGTTYRAAISGRRPRSWRPAEAPWPLESGIDSSATIHEPIAAEAPDVAPGLDQPMADDGATRSIGTPAWSRPLLRSVRAAARRIAPAARRVGRELAAGARRVARVVRARTVDPAPRRSASA